MVSYAALTSREAVEEAIAECRRMGRHTFLERYGFGESRDYILITDDGDFDSKAIFGIAWEKQHGSPLSVADFSGGKDAAAGRLAELGYAITGITPELGTARRPRVVSSGPRHLPRVQDAIPPACLSCGMLLPGTGVCENC